MHPPNMTSEMKCTPQYTREKLIKTANNMSRNLARRDRVVTMKGVANAQAALEWPDGKLNPPTGTRAVIAGFAT